MTERTTENSGDNRDQAARLLVHREVMPNDNGSWRDDSRNRNVLGHSLTTLRVSVLGRGISHLKSKEDGPTYRDSEVYTVVNGVSSVV